MSEQTFMDVPVPDALNFDDGGAAVRLSPEWLLIEQSEWNVADAAALRDWLNQVLPSLDRSDK